MHRTFHSSASNDAPSLDTPSLLSQPVPVASLAQQSTLLRSPHSISQRSHSTRTARRFVCASLSFALFGIYSGFSQAAPLDNVLPLNVELQANKVLLSTPTSSRVLIAQAQTNAPAAAPTEGKAPKDQTTKDPALTGNGVDGTGKVNAPAATGEGAAAPVNPATPVTPVTPATPDAPVPVPGEGGVASSSLAPAQAEGREIVNIRVVGNRVVPEQSILLQATTRRGAAFSSRQLDLDRANIARLGFFAGETGVQYQVTPNLEDPNKVDLTFIVIENRVVTGFRFEGNTTVKTEDLIKVLEIKPGTVLNNNTVNTDVTKIQTLYREKGYAALVTDVKMDADGTLIITVQEAKITKIVIAGLKKTKESLVRNQIRTKPGDPFDQFRVRRDLNRIYDLGFFEDVTYKVDDDAATPGSLIVTLQLKEKRTGQFTVGLGFDSRSKVTGFFTLAENNLRGNGQRAFVSVEAGGQRTFDVGFGDPFVGSKNSSYDISVFDRRIFREPRAVSRVIGTPTNSTQTLFYEEQRTGGRLNYTIPLDEDRNSSVLFGYRNERARLFQTDNRGINIPVNLPVNSSGRVSAFSTGFLRDARDLRLDPSRGSREQVLLERSFSLLGGDVSFTKVDLDLRRYIPLVGPAKIGELPRAVFAARFVAGKSFGQLPAFEQYFIGGSDTVRGYDVDEQLGDNQFYTNLELRYRFQRKFQIVGFVDVGKATGGRFATADEMLVGFGGGIRLQTPIGPIRLDIGRGNNGIRTHFAIGPTF